MTRGFDLFRSKKRQEKLAEKRKVRERRRKERASKIENTSVVGHIIYDPKEDDDMTRKITVNGKTIAVIDVEEEQKCELCGKVTECRPYGPNDEEICHECGQKDPETTKRKMHEYLYGEKNDRA